MTPPTTPSARRSRRRRSAAGDLVNVTGRSKGKGTAGVMKRHGFKGLSASHGTQRKHRSPGSIGGCATPGRVFKGVRMAGRMGDARTTTPNLTVHAVDAERGLLLIRGAVPGPKGGLILVRSAIRAAQSATKEASVSTTVSVVSPSGAKGQDVELPDEIFSAPVNVPLMHQVVVAQEAAARQGTHATKTRGLVRGGGRKPYRQKGTGRARQGSVRAPQYAGGGTVHGPQPRSYVQRTPKKMKAAALRGALSDRASNGRVAVVSGFVSGDAPKTGEALDVLRAAIGLTGAKLRGTVLVVAQSEDELTWKSLRNVPGVRILAAGQLNTYDVLVSEHVVFTQAALEEFTGRGGRRPRKRMSSERDPDPQSPRHPAAADHLGEDLPARGRRQVHLPGSAGRQPDPGPASGRGDLRGQGHRGEHAQPAGQAAPHPVRLGPAAVHQAGHRQPGRG